MQKDLPPKTVILGVTGCIAAYKAAEITRKLKTLGYDVWVIMTKSAQEFIRPLTFETLSGNPCITDMFKEKSQPFTMPHISLSKKADVLLIVPATANIIGKAASGIADDILSTTILSCTCPKIFASAMNNRMWNNPSVSHNVQKLKDQGIEFIGPIKGELACNEEGIGHISDIGAIISAVNSKIGINQDLIGKKILITGGGTREFLDPVRFIGNMSSGKMGSVLASAAASRGADVCLILANSPIDDIKNIDLIRVTTLKQMEEEIKRKIDWFDILIMAAAASDYSPLNLSLKKMKKGKDIKEIKLKPTTDILKTLSKYKKNKIFVGFSVESENLIENSKRKLKEKNLDLIVANNTSALGEDESKISIIAKDGTVEDLGKMNKRDSAYLVLDRISEIACLPK